jgi:hypothetical protein
MQCSVRNSFRQLLRLSRILFRDVPKPGVAGTWLVLVQAYLKAMKMTYWFKKTFKLAGGRKLSFSCFAPQNQPSQLRRRHHSRATYHPLANRDPSQLRPRRRRHLRRTRTVENRWILPNTPAGHLLAVTPYLQNQPPSSFSHPTAALPHLRPSPPLRSRGHLEPASKSRLVSIAGGAPGFLGRAFLAGQWNRRTCPISPVRTA